MKNELPYVRWNIMRWNEWIMNEWNIQQQQTNTFQNFYLDKEPRLQSTFKKIHTECLNIDIILHLSRVMAPSLGTGSRADLALPQFFWLIEIAPPALLSVNNQHDKLKCFLGNEGGLGKVITYHSQWHLLASWKLVFLNLNFDLSSCSHQHLALFCLPASSEEFPISRSSCGFFAGYLNPAWEQRFGKKILKFFKI